MHAAGTLGKNVYVCSELVALCGNFGKEYICMHAAGTLGKNVYVCSKFELSIRLNVLPIHLPSFNSLHSAGTLGKNIFVCTLRELWEKIYVVVRNLRDLLDMGIITRELKQSVQ